ncbi:Ribosomal protein-like protein [Fragilaria crotonensis]|nr:Ribosomal protein-like protein [Fragilaria crotonensis]
MFASAQEAKRKDIERAFGMLQARFHILTSACRLWERHAMKTVIKTCVILHNLVIDFERQNGIDSDYINNEMYIPQHPFVVIPREEDKLVIEIPNDLGDAELGTSHSSSTRFDDRQVGKMVRKQQ